MLTLGKPSGQKEYTEVAQAMCGLLRQASLHIPHGEPEVALAHQLQPHEEAVSPGFPKLDTPLPHLPSFPDFRGFWWRQLTKWWRQHPQSSAWAQKEHGAQSKLNQGIHCQGALHLQKDAVSPNRCQCHSQRPCFSLSGPG